MLNDEYVKTGDLCREFHQFVAKVHQNVSNRVLHYKNNPRVITGPRHWGLCDRIPGEGGREERERREQGREGRRGQLRGKKEGRGREGGIGDWRIMLLPKTRMAVSPPTVATAFL